MNFQNNNFFGYEGTINRKNYIINMLIIITLCACLHFVDFSFYFSFTKLTFLYGIFEFLISLFKYVLMFCAISVIYRRMTDISFNSSSKTKSIVKKIFTFVYIVPLLLYFLGGIVFQQGLIMQFIILTVFFFFLPISVITSFTLCFIKQLKSNNEIKKFNL